MGQVFATAGKDFHPKLILQQANLLADTGLRGIQALCGCGHIEVVVGHLPDIAQLLQFHSSSGAEQIPADDAPSL